MKSLLRDFFKNKEQSLAVYAGSVVFVLVLVATFVSVDMATAKNTKGAVESMQSNLLIHPVTETALPVIKISRQVKKMQDGIHSKKLSAKKSLLPVVRIAINNGAGDTFWCTGDSCVSEGLTCPAGWTPTQVDGCHAQCCQGGNCGETGECRSR